MRAKGIPARGAAPFSGKCVHQPDGASIGHVILSQRSMKQGNELNRKPYIAGNWKMNLDDEQATTLAGTLVDRIKQPEQVDVAIFPSFPYLKRVGAIVNQQSIVLGAQNFYPEPNGAMTGEVSLSMLADVGVNVVLVGHSERRHIIGETDGQIRDKVVAALEADMHVVLCIGETLDQREGNQTDAINGAQLMYGLAGVASAQMARVTIAYEPVWAIGTGRTATPDIAQTTHHAIREHLAHMYSQDIAQETRIQYGGSVKPSNASDLLAPPDVDGFLVGGASLVSDDFMDIIESATGRS